MEYKITEIKHHLKFLFLNASSTSKLRDVHFNPFNTNIKESSWLFSCIVSLGSEYAKTLEYRGMC